MNINLYKYRQADGTIVNYFSQPYSNIGFIDCITLTDIPISGFPIFREEYVAEDDVNILRSGDYDLKFSLLQNEKSYHGFTAKDFLLPAVNRNFLLLCSFEFDGIERWGAVDVTSIRANYTFTKNRYDISFTVYGLLKHLIEGLKLLDFDRRWMGGPQCISWGEWLDKLFAPLLPGEPSSQFDYEDKLGLDDLVGSPVKIDQDLIESMDNNGLNQGYSVWEALKSFAIGLGFVLKLESTSIEWLPPYSLYPVFKLSLIWRHGASEIKDVDVLEDEESNSLMCNNSYLMLIYNKGIQPANERWDMGLFIGKEIISMSDNSDPNHIIIREIPDWPGQIGLVELNKLYAKSLVQELSISFHAQGKIIYGGVTAMNIPFCRALTLTGWNHSGFSDIILNTAANEYKYLVSGVKAVRNLKVSLRNNNYKIFDKINYDNKTWWISRIENLNLREKNADIQMIAN